MSSNMYVKTEEDIMYESQSSFNSPIKVFNLESLGISLLDFKKEIGYTFENLNWDYYDVRRTQISIIEKYFPAIENKGKEILLQYHQDKLTIEDIINKFNLKDSLLVEELRNVLPYRKRAYVKYELNLLDSDSWNIKMSESNSFTQKTDDYRQVARKFEKLDDYVASHPLIQQLLSGIADMVKDIHPDSKRLEVFLHQVSIIARTNVPASNSPEGVHQDGADYIVSALVIEKKQVEGGESRVYLQSGNMKKILSYVLQEGEGIFQVDQDSDLWHDVTPISLKEGSTDLGIRNIFGIDINILK